MGGCGRRCGGGRVWEEGESREREREGERGKEGEREGEGGREGGSKKGGEKEGTAVGDTRVATKMQEWKLGRVALTHHMRAVVQHQLEKRSKKYFPTSYNKPIPLCPTLCLFQLRHE